MDQLKISRAAIAAAAFVALSACGDLSNREDFQSQLKNKTEPEVLRYAGKPAQIDRSDPARVAYIYKKRTFDVASRKTDEETDVIFMASTDGSLHVSDVVFK